MNGRKTMMVAMSIALSAAPAIAHISPSKAKQLKAEIVQGYPPCTAPDTVTTGGTPACDEQPEIDPACTIAPGSGKLSAKVSPTGIKATASLKDLTCEGQTLDAYLDVRTTSDDCPSASGHCTAVDQTLLIGSCVVAGGKCRISADVPTGFTAGSSADFQILGCGLQRGSLKSMSCGILVP